MSQAWLEQFEVRLELMEQRISSDEILFHEVMELACHAFSVLGAGATLDAFVVRPDGIEQFAEDGTTSAVESDVQDLRRALTGHSLNSSQPVHIGSHRLADSVQLACRFTVTENIAPEASCAEGAAALAAVIASLISRRLLTQYETKYQQQVNLVSVVAQLASASNFAETASVLAQDGASVLGDCRVSVLSETAGRLQTHAVTGVSAPNASSSAVAEMEVFTRECIQQQKTSTWLTTDEVGELSRPMAGVFAASNVKHAQVVAFPETQLASKIGACMVVECFGLPLPEQYAVDQLAKAAAPVVKRYQRQQLSIWRRFTASRSLRQALIAMAAVLLLAVVPADFEIEVDGQIQPTTWRRIYAPANGTVELVEFKNEQDVVKDRRLLQLSNPDIELSLQRVLGDIQTTQARLATAETARLTGSDPLASSDEQLLQVELANLKKDRTLIEIQNDELTVKAPFNGTVFLQDPQKQLAVRPVQRGQLLCQVVAKESGWQLELDVPEHLRQYVLSGDANDSQREVRYLIKASPGADWQTKLTAIDSAVQVRKGQLVCRATAAISELPEANRRPGTSVSARVHCGRRSLGFVWFREVIEVWRQIKFAWL